MKYILTFFMFGALLSAGPVSVTLVNAGNPVLHDGNGVDVGPYTLSLNGMNYAALCVDNKDWSQLNSPWSADLTAVNSSNLSDTYHPAEGIEYEEDAYLYSLITKPGADRVDLQHAAWDIINDSITSSTSLAGLHLFSGDTSLINQATADYNKSGLNFADFEIVSGFDKGTGREQEFIIGGNCDAPEPASFALLGVGLLMAGTTRAWRKRKQVASVETI